MDFMNFEEVIKEKSVKWLDFRFVDINGRTHHISSPTNNNDYYTMIKEGISFHVSTIPGLSLGNQNTLYLKPELETAYIDPFSFESTLNIMCSLITAEGIIHPCDSRSIAQKAEEYLINSGIANRAFFAPEAEFMIFDNIKFGTFNHSSFHFVESNESEYNSENEFYKGNSAYKIPHQCGKSPTPPLDIHQDFRNETCNYLMESGIKVEFHHHEVAAGQVEIVTKYDTLTKSADNLIKYKYIVHNTAKKHGKFATFMPKPALYENGNGMHTHISLFRDEIPLFFEKEGYGNLSELALNYLGGVLFHAPSLISFTNSSTNSYKRIRPNSGPTNLTFSKFSRSSAIRIPYISNGFPEQCRLEFRTPDGSCNPYLAFSAILMAGLDGIRNKIDPFKRGYGPIDENDDAKINNDLRKAPKSLDESLDHLEIDHNYLMVGGVFSKEIIQTFIRLKREEAEKVSSKIHPFEFSLYFSI